MPSDQLLKCIAVAVLRLFDEEFFVLGFVNSLCGPFQYRFHGHGLFGRPWNQKVGGND
jgi:hypothetical protein